MFLNFQPRITGSWSDFWQILIGNGPIKDGSKNRECVTEALGSVAGGPTSTSSSPHTPCRGCWGLYMGVLHPRVPAHIHPAEDVRVCVWGCYIHEFQPTYTLPRMLGSVSGGPTSMSSSPHTPCPGCWGRWHGWGDSPLVVLLSGRSVAGGRGYRGRGLPSERAPCVWSTCCVCDQGQVPLCKKVGRYDVIGGWIGGGGRQGRTQDFGKWLFALQRDGQPKYFPFSPCGKLTNQIPSYKARERLWWRHILARKYGQGRSRVKRQRQKVCCVFSQLRLLIRDCPTIRTLPVSTVWKR